MSCKNSETEHMFCRWFPFLQVTSYSTIDLEPSMTLIHEADNRRSDCMAGFSNTALDYYIGTSIHATEQVGLYIALSVTFSMTVYIVP